MCISWLKKLFVNGEPVLGSGNTEHVSDTETGTTVAPIDPETGSNENNNNVAEPIIIAKKKYEGVNFHVLLDNGHASSTPGKRQQLDNGQYFYEYFFLKDIAYF